jgi:DNA-binding NarL/FixJ family response regulator
MDIAARPAAAVTVLVADDDPDIRLLVRMTLAADAVPVIGEAADGDDALELYRRLSHTERPTVVVLDNRMPGLSGMDVARRILADVPEQHVVLFSAHLSPPIVAEAEALGIRVCLMKTEYRRLPAMIAALVG